MPTGFTAPVADGVITDFNEFVWRCSRGMRDQSLDAPIDFAKDDLDHKWHREALDNAYALMRRMETISEAEAEAEAAQGFDDAVQRFLSAVASEKQKRERYEAMRAKVAAWQPPTPEHEGLRSFMLEQLDSSIRFDCHESDYPMPRRMTGAEWKELQIGRAKRDIEYHSERLAEAKKHAAERRAWLEALAASVPLPEKLRK